MPRESKKTDSEAPGTQGQSEAREQRLAAALRDNLRKRKAQQRGRSAVEAAEDSGEGGGRD